MNQDAQCLYFIIEVSALKAIEDFSVTVYDRFEQTVSTKADKGTNLLWIWLISVVLPEASDSRHMILIIES